VVDSEHLVEEIDGHVGGDVEVVFGLEVVQRHFGEVLPLQPLLDAHVGLEAQPLDVLADVLGAHDFADLEKLVNVIHALEEDPFAEDLAGEGITMEANQQPVDQMSRA
jgi:hypothetical protein